jgi:fibronectin type 3 domain-containing protein
MKPRISILTLAAAAVMLCAFSSRTLAHPTKGIFPLCTFLSVTLPDDSLSKEKRIYHPGLVTWNRDYPYGIGTPPTIGSVEMIKPFPNPNDLLTVQITTKGGTPEVTDNLTTGAQRIMSAELAISFNSGSWRMNQSSVGAGVPMDYFKREVMNVLNNVGKKWKTYQAPSGSWAVSLPFTPQPSNAPAPNRRGAMPAGFGAYAYEFPWNYPCPYGNNCPLWDDWGPVDTGYGVDFLAARPVSCTKGAGNCNVPGFPEGGGDLMDYFPQYDPVPGTDFPNIPGEPIIRVNGVPGISCGIYNGDDGKPTHPLCAEFPDASMIAIYDAFGIYSYTLNPDSGKVMFSHALTNQDVVDAVFYVHTRGAWTARIDMSQAPFNTANMPGGNFQYFARVLDTCGNLATGSKSPPFPTFNPTNNENSYVEVEDFHWDLVPTDQDAMIQALDDRPDSCCGCAAGAATEEYCPGAAAPEDWNLLTDGAPCAFAECECCYNECGPTTCQWNSPVYNSCNNVGDAGNAPGCGHEFQGKTGMAEIHNLKVSHSSANLYLKLETQGEIVFGCYGSWYPIIGCEVLNFDKQASKFTGYTWRITNQGSNAGTFFLIVIPDIPIYGEIVLFLDLNALISGGLGSNYQSCDLESYADGGGQCNFCNTDTASEDPCAEMGCDPESDPNGDCDGDAIYGPFSNGTDPCPCEDGGVDSSDGCPVEEPDDGGGIEDFMCQSCSIEKQNNRLYVEMAIEGQVQRSGEAPYEILGMVLGLHDFEVCMLMEAACFKNFSFSALASDQAPRINYYHTGDKSRKDAVIRADVTAPETPRIKACLGRCDEAVNDDLADNDADPVAFEDPIGNDPAIATRVDEGFDPTAVEIELKFPEVIYNTDSNRTFIRDLGGYKIYISRGQSQDFRHYYTICNSGASADCDGKSPTDGAGVPVARDNAAMDEPYAPNGQRFPIPADETASLSGWNFPGEKIACVMDADCDIPGNNLDDDKDGLVDEGCYTTNCHHDNDPNVQLAEDGQTYNFRTLAYDTTGNLSQWSNTVTVTILRNTTTPMKPVIRHAYQLAEGRSTKVVWDLNPESDMGGYAVYRCPSRPIDAVMKTENGTLEDYCVSGADSETHYRMVTKDILHQLNKYAKDDGMGYYEGGVGAVNTEDTCDRNGDGNPDQIFGDDNCNWDPATGDVGMDGLAGTNDPGEGDGLPTRGEPNANELIDCSSLSKDNVNLKYCGNMDPAWNVGDEIYDTDGKTRIALYQATDSVTRPVLFYTGLVDGYTYYYKVKAIDTPYRGDGLADPGTCNNGMNAWRRDTKQGCVNPIDDTDGVEPVLRPRNCDDPLIRFNWQYGGNCSEFSDSVAGVPADTQPPAIPASIRADGNSDGVTVTLSWSMLDDDITLDHYRIYRSNKETGPFACVHGGCQSTPYINGCHCQNDSDCYTGSSCTYPVKICTNPPDFTIDPQPSGCGAAPFNDGCQCENDSDCRQDTCQSSRCTLSKESCISDADCTTSRTCTFQYKSCQPTGVPMALNDGIDNDGDGTIDEDIAGNSIDDDGDGLVDEDTGQQEVVTMPDNSIKYLYLVGSCPTLDPDPAAPLKYTVYESMTATDYGLSANHAYYYRVTGVDNAVFDPPDDDAIYDVHPPNEGEKSTAVPVQAVDATAPSPPTGTCSDPLTLAAEPCVEVNTTIPPRDDTGGQLTITWTRNSESDVIGYKLYRAVNENGVTEPSTALYNKINDALIAQPALGANSVFYKDTLLENGKNYFYMITAVDAHYNESTYSEVAGPGVPQDLMPTSAPRWDPLYRTLNIGCNTAARPSNCTTELATNCVSGGVFSDGSGQAVVLQWAPHNQTVCDPNSITEGDFQSFNIYRSETPACTISSNQNCNPGLDCMVASNVVNTFYRHDEDVVPGITYYYCLSAVDSSGNPSPVSDSRSITPIDAMPPDKPTGLTATALVNSTIGLGWNKGTETDIAGWRIYRSQTGLEGSFVAVTLSGANLVAMDPDGVASSGDEFQVVNALTYKDIDLVTDTTFYYKIAAVDNLSNESKKSDAASAKTAVVDTTAPGKPATITTRSGFDLGESGASGSDGADNDGEGIIDDGNLKARNVEIHWDRITVSDLASYNVYRLDPPNKTNCTCDPDNNPLGDCDNDGVANNIDDCPCTPANKETDPFRSNWTLIVNLDAAAACPTGTHARPTGRESANSCLYTDKNNGLGLCNDCQYWYQVLGVDTSGNETALDATAAWPAVPEDRVPANTMNTPDKPKTESPVGGGKLIVKVKPLDTSATANENVVGYMIWRDTKASGDYATKLTTINDISKVKYCDTTLPDYFCIDDISVVNDTRYYYKVSAFDRWGRETEKSSFGYGTPSVNGQPLDVTGVSVQPAPDDSYRLKLFWTPRTGDTIAGYKVLRGNDEAGPFGVITPGNPTVDGYFPKATSQYNDSNLTMGQKYCYMIIVIDTTGAESPGITVCGTPGSDAIPPSRPESLTATSGNASAQLKWTANSEPDLAGYRIYKSETTKTAFVQINSELATYPRYNVSGLKNETVYWFKVTAVDFAGNESQSSPLVSATPKATGKVFARAVTRGWNLVTIPLASSESTVTIQTQSMRVPARASDKIYSFTQAGKYLEVPADSIMNTSQGLAFWYYVDDETDPLFVEGQLNTDTEIEIQLQPGWNLVGNPFVESLPWKNENVMFSADDTNWITLGEALDGGFVKFAVRYVTDFDGNGSYEQLASDGSDLIPAGHGLWVKLDRQLTILLKK